MNSQSCHLDTPGEGEGDLQLLQGRPGVGGGGEGEGEVWREREKKKSDVMATSGEDFSFFLSSFPFSFWIFFALEGRSARVRDGSLFLLARSARVRVLTFLCHCPCIYLTLYHCLF